MNSLCNCNFKSQVAFIDNKSIHIDDFYKDYIDRKNDLKCRKGHELIPNKPKIKKSYFRHKNTSDVSNSLMSKWHVQWQNEFENTEITFHKLPNQIKERRADVFIPMHNLVVELQHSKISKEEVDNRKHDYKLHNNHIIWIIDGNCSMDMIDLENERKFIIFDNCWLYESFISYDFIFIDYENEIYKLYPKEVKNRMIDVETPYDKNIFIDLLNENNDILYEINIPHQCILHINQLGAGNGKTYGIIQKLESDDFKHYKQFIVVTKQHSAKEIIYREFIEQIEQNKLENISNLVLLDDKDKKYILTYKNNKSELECQMVICTIDSLMCRLGDTSIDSTDKFISIIKSIVDDYIQKEQINGLSYGSMRFRLNKEICVIIDETQDLSENYAEALVKLMRSRYVDAYIVGDKLQSISVENNAFTYFEKELPYIQKVKPESINVCRRFINPILIDFCNKTINYDKYELPNVQPYKDEPCNQQCLEFIECFDTCEDRSKLNDNVEKIMEKYIFEVEINGCLPKDFLIVTPFTKDNVFADSVQMAINGYWKEKLNGTKYIQYAIFHKSEQGTSIDTKLSDNATRIVSIHSAKGDGRKIVFVIGLNEISLKRFSKGKINLIYESLYHVAITRMKEKLYFAYIANNDNIHQRITQYCVNNETEIKLSIIESIKTKYNDIISIDTNDDILNKLKEEIMIHCDYDDCSDNDNKQIIDMQHHNIRYFCMRIAFWLKIIKKDDHLKRQITAIFYNIINSNLCECTKWQDYNKKLLDNRDINNDFDNKEKRHLCVLSYGDKNVEYKKYYDIIIENIKSVKKKLNDIIKLKDVYLCPYESIILYYMYSICEYGNKSHDFTITELYDITDIYHKSFNYDIEMHDKCQCKKCFPNNTNNTNNNTLYQYLLHHYEKICILNSEYNKFLENNPNINLIVSQNIKYKGKNDNYKINKQLCIAYNNDNVYIIVLHPSFNTLNHNQYLLESIYDTYLLINRKPLIENDEKFGYKKIKTILFSCDEKKHYVFNWSKNEINYIIENNLFFKQRIKEYFVSFYKSQIKQYYLYILFSYTKSNEKKPWDKIEEIINNMVECPHFINDYLVCIKHKLTDVKNDKNQIKIIINNDIKNEKIFCDKLDNDIDSSIDYFLGLNNDDGDDNYDSN